jgi:hypothetical protein
MGWEIVMGECCVCHRVFGFNPHRVPSVRVNGNREPVCRACVEQANVIRKAGGLDELQILPGAYDPEEV